MAKNLFSLIVILFWAIMVLTSSATTDESDVQALHDLYRSLNSPMQLEHWRSEGGDPCEGTWIGVQCFGSSVINLKLNGLGLTGNLGFLLSNLKSLKHLDLSSNSIGGSIPFSLPSNLTHLNLAMNKFTQTIPYSLETMKHLRHLNLSHNMLFGPLGDVFNGLDNLKEMDLSFNRFFGDLPPSFRSLTNLTGLFLQSNQFTGSVVYLANLSLSDLNIEDNHFSGVIPEKFQNIANLRFGGNKFDRAINYPPWKFPSNNMPTQHNITTPPATNLSAFESHPSQITGHHDKKKSHIAGILMMISGVTLMAAIAAIAIVVHKHQLHVRIWRSREDSVRSLPIGTMQATLDSPHLSAVSTSPMITPSRLPAVPTKVIKVSRRKSFSRSKMIYGAKAYTLAELQIATNSFSEENLIGEGSLGSVYRAEFLDGKIFAVKNIKTVPLSIIEEQQFFDVIKIASRLKHPHIVPLLGYCLEHDQHLLVYEFVRSLSLDEALHCTAYKPLPWSLRLRIAFAVARALDYIHSTTVPTMAHSNLKAANILLDEELMPHLSDCGLAILRPLSSNTVKLKASEMAIADSGYIAPEHSQPGIGNTKADIYAFGVLLLELLTRRKPFDCSRPNAEQSLARWASSRLHDSTSLRQMVDPAITRTISSKSLSRFADIVSLCTQPEQEFRPTMPEIMIALKNLNQMGSAPDGSELDSFDRSFRSTNTRFLGSPAQSYYSI